MNPENFQLRNQFGAISRSQADHQRANRTDITQLSKQIKQMTERRDGRDDRFDEFNKLIGGAYKTLYTDFDFPRNKVSSDSTNIKMYSQSTYKEDRGYTSHDDDDLESGIKLQSDKKIPQMQLQLASAERREPYTASSRVTLPANQHGQDQIQIYNKPPQNLISGKHPRFPVHSPTSGTSEQLREIFEPKPETREKFTFESKARAQERGEQEVYSDDWAGIPGRKQTKPYNSSQHSIEEDAGFATHSGIESTLKMQRELDEVVKQHTRAEPIKVQQYPHSPRNSRYTGESISAIQTSASGYPSGSSTGAQVTFFSLNPERTITQREEKKELPEPVKVKPKTLAHFFETPSRYISVKAFNAQNADQYVERLKELKPMSNEVNKDVARYRIIKNWFKELSLQELAIVVTTIDRDLVRLLRAMYKTQRESSGKFVAKLDKCNNSYEADKFERVNPYQLLFSRDKNNLSFVPGQQHRVIYSQNIQKRAKACDWLIKGVRFINVQIQGATEDKIDGDPINALTLDHECIMNPSFLCDMLKAIDSEFFIREFQCQKLQQQIEGSLLVGAPVSDQSSTQQSRTAKTAKMQKSNQTNKEKNYFLVQDPQRKIFNASQPSEIDAHTFNQYSMQTRADLESAIDLAQVILLVIEKGINIHFMDFLDKMQNQTMHNFFFVKMSDLVSDVFNDDLKVANYWFNLPLDKKQKQFEVLDEIGADLLRIYNNSRHSFDKIDEEDITSRKSETDSNNDDSDDFSMEPRYKGRKKIGALNPRFQLAHEYHEAEQERLPSDAIHKKRRGRKDRVRGPNGEKSVTTSSSGAQFEGYNYCDYNPNQLRSTYSNNVVEEEHEELKAVERKINSRHYYECMGDMAIDPMPTSDNSDIDPEDLRPYNQQDTAFSNSASFDYRNYPKIQSETRELPAFIQQKLKPLHISVSLPDNHEEPARNDLMGPSQPSNQMFSMKQEIKSLGMKNGSFKECLQFVKMLSTCYNIDTYVRDSEAPAKRRNEQLKIEELRPLLRSRFYQQLSKICTDSILADLMMEPQGTSKKQKKTKLPLSKVEEVKAKTPPTQTSSASIKESQQPKEPIAMITEPANEPEKKKKKKKNKKKKKADIPVDVKISEQKDKLSDVASDHMVNICEQDTIQQIASDLCRYSETASGPGANQVDPVPSDESVTSSVIDRMQAYNQMEQKQNLEVEELFKRMERIKTVDVMMEQGVSPDDCDMILSGHKNIPRDYEDSNSDDNDEAIQRMLNSMTNEIRQNEIDSRFKEERTGLLSNQVHMDKYKRETIQELELIEKRRLSPSFESSEMINYVLAQNQAANEKVRAMRNLSPDNRKPTQLYNLDNDRWQMKPAMSERQQLLNTDSQDDMIQKIHHIHYYLLCKKEPLPEVMTLRQRQVVLKILQEQYEQKQKELSQQSGNGPVEETKGAPGTNVTKTEEPKKKSKKKSKKNRRQTKPIVIDNKTKPVEESKPLLLPVETEMTVDDVEEVILPEDPVSQAHTCEKAVLRNNFLVEEQPKAHVVTVADHAVEVENPEKEEMLEREDYVQSITNQLIQNALQNFVESPQTQTVLPRNTRNKRNKGKPKANNEMQFQQKAKPETKQIEEQKAKETQQRVQSPVRMVKPMSGQMSSDAASNGKGVPVYCSTPIMDNPHRPASVVSSFKCDLSDKNGVEIPKRGISNSSYGKDTQNHEQTLLELDALFPSGKKGSGSGSSIKIRSSTLSKDRLSTMGKTKASIESPARLSKLHTAQNDDVLSQRITKKQDKEIVQPESPLLQISKPETKTQLRTEDKTNAPRLTKRQKNQRKKQLAEQETQSRAEEAKDGMKNEEPKVETRHEEKQELERKDKTKQQYQARDLKNTQLQYVPKTTTATVPTSAQSQVLKTEEKSVSKQEAKPKPVEQKQKQIDTKPLETKPAAESKQSEPKQVEGKPQQKEKTVKQSKPQTFTSFDSMFESVYGAKAISGIIVPSNDKPSEKAKVAIDVETDKKQVKPEKSDKVGKTNEVKTEHAQIASETKESESKPKQKETTAIPKGRGQQVNIKHDPKQAIDADATQSVTIERIDDVQKRVQVQQQKQTKQQYACSTVQTSVSSTSTQQTTVVKQQVTRSNLNQENVHAKRNRGAQFPPTSLGNSVTNSNPTVASNSSQTMNLQQISNQQQTQYTVNLNIVNTTNQFVTPAPQQYLTPQQQMMQQQMQYMQMVAQQQFMGQPGYASMPPTMAPYANFNQFVRPVAFANQVKKEEESKEELIRNDQESVDLQQQMNHSTSKSSPTNTAASTPQRTYSVPPSLPTIYPRPMLPVPGMYPYYGQKPVYTPMYQQSFMYQHSPTPVFQVSKMFERVHAALSNSENLHVRLSDAEVHMIVTKFFTSLGKQVFKIMAKIETRLAQIEEFKEATFSRIQQIAKQTFTNDLEFEIYGSMATKLAIDTSDMDIAIYGIMNQEEIASSLNPKEIAVSAMEQLNMRFEAVDWIANTRVIGTASVPVIKLEVDLVKLAKSIKDTKEPEVKTLKIDIIFNDLALPRSKDSLSLDVSECLTKRCAGYVRQQIVEHPFLKPLVVVLKKYLSLKNLNNSFMGTVSSYGLVLMILALLEDMKRSEPSLNLEQVVGELAEFNLGKAIANFFFVYGEQFQTQFCMVNSKSEFCEPEDTIGMLNTNGSYVLQVIDPCNDQNNVGKQTYRFEEVQEQFQITFECLLNRFMDFYNLEAKVFDLQRRMLEIDGAIRMALQFKSAVLNDEKPLDDEHGSLFEDFTDQSQHSLMWFNNPYLQQNLLQRGQAQLKLDAKEGKEIIDKILREKQSTAQTLFDRVLMVNSETLTAVEGDADVDQVRVMVQLKKQFSLVANLVDTNQEPMFGTATDIQELLTGQQQPVFPYQSYFQGYNQYPQYVHPQIQASRYSSESQYLQKHQTSLQQQKQIQLESLSTEPVKPVAIETAKLQAERNKMQPGETGKRAKKKNTEPKDSL